MSLDIMLGDILCINIMYSHSMYKYNLYFSMGNLARPPGIEPGLED